MKGVIHSMKHPLLLVCSIALGHTAYACSPSGNTYTGSVCAFAGDACPQGSLEADGQSLPITQYLALYSLLGTTYGGDGKTYFQLPNLQGTSIVGVQTTKQPFNTLPFKLGKAQGAATTTLTIDQLPPHTHPVEMHDPKFNAGTRWYGNEDDGTAPTPSINNAYVATSVWALNRGGNPMMVYSWANTPGTPTLVGVHSVMTGGEGTLGNSGAGQPFSTQSPALGLHYCVVTSGIYPSRP